VLPLAATVMRPTPLRPLVTPVARVQLSPLSVERQICPSVVPLVALGSASSEITKLPPPVCAIDQT
jgi:hypothetical protein